MPAKNPGIAMTPNSTQLTADGTLHLQPGQAPGVAGLGASSVVAAIPSVMFSEKQCGHVLTTLFRPELADFEGYQFQLTIIYTDGKTGRPWSDFPGLHAKGVMTGAFLIPKELAAERVPVAAGGALIDLRACADEVSAGTTSLRVPPGGGPLILETRRATLADLRYAVIATLAHEMFHMIQSWRAGNRYDGKKVISPSDLRYAETFLELKKQIRRDKPDASEDYLNAAAHARHPDEQSAERLSRGRLGRYRAKVSSGSWDDCLPILALNSLAR